MNCLQTQIVAFEKDLKRPFVESVFINSTPSFMNERSTDRFPQIYKAIFGNNYKNIRLHISLRFGVQYHRYRTSCNHVPSVDPLLLFCSRCHSPGASLLLVGWNVGVVFKKVLQQLSEDLSCAKYVCLNPTNKTLGVYVRDVTRLDGALGKKEVWCSHVWTWGLSEANALYRRRYL